jgi:hypothetical protein
VAQPVSGNRWFARLTVRGVLCPGVGAAVGPGTVAPTSTATQAVERAPTHGIADDQRTTGRHSECHETAHPICSISRAVMQLAVFQAPVGLPYLAVRRTSRAGSRKPITRMQDG